MLGLLGCRRHGMLLRIFLHGAALGAGIGFGKALYKSFSRCCETEVEVHSCGCCSCCGCGCRGGKAKAASGESESGCGCGESAAKDA